MMAPPVVVLRRLPEVIEEMAKDVVVAAVVVEKSPVKFCRVEEPEASKFPTVTKLEKVGVPPQVPLSAPPLVALNAPEIVEEPVTESAEVVPEVREKLPPVMSPVFEILKSVVEAPVLEVEPIAKRVVRTEVEALWTERSAKGEDVPTPRSPPEVTVVVPVWPKLATLASRVFAKKEVEVACCSEELPSTVSAPLAFRFPPTLRTEEMVVDPVTASADEVAPRKSALTKCEVEEAKMPWVKAMGVEVELMLTP